MILISGASGFLGREIAFRLSRSSLCYLLRPASSSPATPGTEVRGELRERYLGLGQREFDDLARKITAIYHCAASTSLSQSLANARATNVGGTAHLLELADRAWKLAPHRFIGFFHISTAYVAGDTDRVVGPDELTFANGFRNSYERSKAEAEELVRSRQGRYRIGIFRPSMIVGDSVTGHTSAFNTVYIPARLWTQGLLQIIPARPSAPFDLVPVDYVAETIVRLSQAPFEGLRSYHVCAGVGRESTPWEILHFLIAAFHEYGKRSLECLPAFLSPELLLKLSASIRSVSEAAHARVRTLEQILGKRLTETLPLLPYMLRNPRFDVTATAGEWRHAPLFSEYGKRLFRYCAETEWGTIARMGKQQA